MENQCQICSSILSSKYNLKIHILKNKKCLKLRNKCISCSYNCIDQTDLKTHLLTCKDHIIKELKQENDKLKQEHKEYIDKLKQEHQEYIDKLEFKLDSLIKDTINRPSTINNTTINNIKHLLSTTYTLECLEDKHIENVIKENFTKQVFMNGQLGLAKMCTDKLINTQDDKKILICTDITRKKFKHKDKNGNIKEDIEARTFINKISKPIKDVGKNIYDKLMDNIDKERQIEDSNKDKLRNESLNVMENYRDIISIDHPKCNSEFMNELAKLNKES